MSNRSLWLFGLPLCAAVGCSPVGSAPIPTPSGAVAVGSETLPTSSDDSTAPPKPIPGLARASSLDPVPIAMPDDKELAEKSVDELLGLARRTLNPDQRLRILEILLEKDAENRQALTMAMVTTQMQAQEVGIQQGDRPASIPTFMKSGEYARKLRTAYPEPANDEEANAIAMALYNAACTLAIQDKADEAMEYMTEAIEAGFNDPVLKDDQEIDSLRKREDFIALLKRQDGILADLARRRAEARAKKGPSTEVKESDVAKLAAAVEEELARFKSFPFNFSLKDLDDKPISLADYKGKVLIVDLWGTWCGPCQQEIPQFVRLHKKYNEKGLEIVGINFENAEGEEAEKLVRDFAKEFGIPYTCALGDREWLETVPGARGFPTTLFIDREGKVRLLEVGYSSEMAPKLEAIVKALLEEGAVEAE